MAKITLSSNCALIVSHKNRVSAIFINLYRACLAHRISGRVGFRTFHLYGGGYLFTVHLGAWDRSWRIKNLHVVALGSGAQIAQNRHKELENIMARSAAAGRPQIEVTLDGEASHVCTCSPKSTNYQTWRAIWGRPDAVYGFDEHGRSIVGWGNCAPIR